MKQKYFLCLMLSLLLTMVSPFAFAAMPDEDFEYISGNDVPGPEPEQEAEPETESTSDSDLIFELEQPDSFDEEEFPLDDESQDEVETAEEQFPEEGTELDDYSEPPAEPMQPVIQLVVPDSGYVIVNPYGMEVTQDGQTTTDQIISPTMPITNYSNVPVRISARILGSAPSDSGAVFIERMPDRNSIGKEVFLYLELQPDGSEWEDGFFDNANQMLILDHEIYKDDLLYLPAGDVEPADGWFRIFGGTSASFEEMWTVDDIIHVSVAFTFRVADDEAQNEL